MDNSTIFLGVVCAVIIILVLSQKKKASQKNEIKLPKNQKTKKTPTTTTPDEKKTVEVKKTVSQLEEKSNFPKIEPVKTQPKANEPPKVENAVETPVIKEESKSKIVDLSAEMTKEIKIETPPPTVEETEIEKDSTIELKVEEPKIEIKVEEPKPEKIILEPIEEPKPEIKVEEPKIEKLSIEPINEPKVEEPKIEETLEIIETKVEVPKVDKIEIEKPKIVETQSEPKVQVETLLPNLEGIEISLEGKKILLVDDDPLNLFSTVSILEEEEIETEIAKSGIECLEKLKEEENFDMILMDIMMPEMDGYEAMTEIRKMQRFQKLPIIALTAKSMAEDRQKCIDSGANDYLSKPIDPDELIALIKKWIK
ncbi:MAG: response regulator [Calditrichaeota bacterium]|nr:MAG: response regulator [Calditrichota bacterium]